MSYILVFVQFFVSFLMFFLMLQHFSFSLIGSILFILGFSIGIIALKTNPPSNINIRPDIKKDSTLITHGIYKYIRHPMYLSVMLMTLSFVFFYKSFIEIFLWIIVFVDLIVKLLYEEKLWSRDKKYKEYMKNSYRLIPFIW